MPELLRRCTLLLPSLGFTRFRDMKDVRSLLTILISLGLLIRVVDNVLGNLTLPGPLNYK